MLNVLFCLFAHFISCICRIFAYFYHFSYFAFYILHILHTFEHIHQHLNKHLNQQGSNDSGLNKKSPVSELVSQSLTGVDYDLIISYMIGPGDPRTI